MEEKLIGREQEEPTVEKKAYVPPTLTIYGKLTELTAGQSGSIPESIAGNKGVHTRPG